MGNDVHGRKGSRHGQRDGKQGAVIPQLPLTEVGQVIMGRHFLSASRDEDAYTVFVDVWQRLSANERESVVESTAASFIRDVDKEGNGVMWEEVNRLLRVWSSRTWDKHPEAIDTLLTWLREQQATILANDPALRAEVARFKVAGNAASVAA